jgi:diguanylate cyclase (GGDEF)-like protein
MSQSRKRERIAEDPRQTPVQYKERLNCVTALSRNWYWEQDENFRFTAISGDGLESSGIDWRRYLGKTRWDSGAMPVEDGGSWKHHKERLEARQPFTDFVFKVVNLQLETCYISTSGQPLFDKKGKFKGYRGVARDVTASVRADQLLRLEHAVTLCLAEADSVAAALQTAIRQICETEKWEYGQYWRIDDKTGTLRPDALWVAPGAGAEILHFIEASRAVVFRRGVGLIGAVFETGEPLWVTDVTEDPRVFRKELARESGLRGAFRFAATTGEHVLGVFDFASRQLREPDKRLLQAVRIIGSQIGQFLQRKQADERVQYLATHDGLTSLPNRMMFGQLLNHAIQVAQRQKHNLGVLFVDLDHFKVVNDTLGHGAGDALLIEISKRLTECVRASDIVARLGGDEFVMLLQDLAGAEHAATVARKILSAAIKPVTISGQNCRVSASIGISMFPADGHDEQTLMKNADVAMYLAKEEGKNNYQFFTEEIRTKSLERQTLETSLRHALERNEFALHYQAKLDLTTKQITGVEALLRWEHPDLGTVSPARFIPIAEETGLIVPIGRWVLATACTQVAAWQREGLPPLRVAVILSARQFTDESLLMHIAEALKVSAIRPELLELELSESIVMQNRERAIKLLAAIKKMGVRIALDDFGLGYASLAHINRYPIDTLKVDRSFIRDLSENSEDTAIAKAIIAMGKTLSLTVVAEGVETHEQAVFLRDQACDEMQGYYFHKPVSGNAFAELLRQHGPANV